MRRGIGPVVLGAALALAGCGRGSAGSAKPDWEDARTNLPANINEDLKRPAPAGRGAQSSDSISAGDLISLDRKGWRYTWQVESEGGTNLVLKPVDVSPMK